MAQNLNVPDISPYADNNGRPTSASGRSQRSGGSLNSPPFLQPIVTTPDADFTQRPSIRIRRLSSTQGQEVPSNYQDTNASTIEGHHVGVRRNRSISDPQRHLRSGEADLGNSARRGSYMPEVTEETTSPTTGQIYDGISPFPPANSSGEEIGAASAPRTQKSSSFAGWRPLRRARTNIGEASVPPSTAQQEEYESDLVDLLDLVDPEVATLSTLTNLQNSLFVPDLGKYLNRRPTYNLTRRPTDIGEDSSSTDDGGTASKQPTQSRMRPTVTRTHTGATLDTITSNVNERFYAVLPHGVSLPGWSEEDKLDLNDHVRHMLHSRRSKFKRSMKGFGQYVRKPLGFFVTLYATLITLFGLAWVLFLIGWINVEGRQSYLINVIDNVLVALFAVVGDGLAPFRAVDTYHMIYIAHYHHKTWDLRKRRALPELQNHNDLPSVQPEEVQDIEKQEFSVLNPEQVKKLQHHQKKFAKSHSFYKPHETTTHHAFPLRLLVAIVVLLDCHSLLQIALGTCTWAISYHVRPFALTTVILCCSITCNITAGVLISVGDHKTRKKDVREKMFRQELTAEALKKVEKKRNVRASMDIERLAEEENTKSDDVGEEEKEKEGGLFEPIKAGVGLK